MKQIYCIVNGGRIQGYRSFKKSSEMDFTDRNIIYTAFVNILGKLNILFCGHSILWLPIKQQTND